MFRDNRSITGAASLPAIQSAHGRVWGGGGEGGFGVPRGRRGRGGSLLLADRSISHFICHFDRLLVCRRRIAACFPHCSSVIQSERMKWDFGDGWTQTMPTNSDPGKGSGYPDALLPLTSSRSARLHSLFALFRKGTDARTFRIDRRSE